MAPLTSVIGLLCVLLPLCYTKKLPDFIPTCKRNDPNFDKCVIDAVEVVRPYLKEGIPKIRVQSLEPLHIPQLSINRDTDSLKVKADLKDLKVWGGINFKINRLKTNLDKLTLDLQVSIPYVYVTSDYVVDGRLLVVPLKGTGIFQGNMTNLVADVKANGEMITSKKGVKYVQAKTIKVKAKVGDNVVKFINTDKNPQIAAITQTAATFVNSNRQQVLEIVLPIAEETAEALAKQMANNMLKTIPFDELVPTE